MSLVSTLVAIVIVSILALTISTLVVGLTRESKALSQKFEVLELQLAILSLFSRPSNCSCHFNSAINGIAPGPLTVNSTSGLAQSHDIDLAAIRTGCDFGSTENFIVRANVDPSGAGFVAESIRVENVRPTGSTGEYVGELTLRFGGPGMIRPLAPLIIPLRLAVNLSAGTVSSRPIQGCLGTDQDLSLNGRRDFPWNQTEGAFDLVIPSSMTPVGSTLHLHIHNHIHLPPSATNACLVAEVRKNGSYVDSCRDYALRETFLPNPTFACTLPISNVSPGTYRISYQIRGICAADDSVVPPVAGGYHRIYHSISN